MINVIFNKNIPNGWYIAQVMENITYDGHRLDIPFVIEDKVKYTTKSFKGKNTVNFIQIYEKHQKSAEDNIPLLLSCLGIWDKFTFNFPDDDTSVFDPDVIKYIKIQTPGRFCTVRVSHDEFGFNRITAIAKVGLPEKELEENFLEIQGKLKSKINELFCVSVYPSE